MPNYRAHPAWDADSSLDHCGPEDLRLPSCATDSVVSRNCCKISITLTMKNILKFTVTGVVAGVLLGWLLSLVSGNIFVVLMVGTLGLFVGGVLGIVHRNDPKRFARCIGVVV